MIQNRREFLVRTGQYALGLTLVTRTRWSNSFSESTPGRLRFIFILADDLGYTDLGSYGSTFYETPNIDGLVARGMKFTDAYAAAPVCSPTRASILTGRYPARLHLTDWIPGRPVAPWARLVTPKFRQELPLEEVTTPEELKPHGYTSASIGKWHLGGPPYWPEKHGFDLNFGGTAAGSPSSYFPPYNIPNLPDGPKGEYLTDRLTDETIKFIRENRGKPFYIYLSHFAVHDPLQAKENSIAHFESKLKPGQAQHNPIYAAMIQSLDEGVGRILSVLKELNLEEDTVIFFMSDNGGLVKEPPYEHVTWNVPLRAGKGHLYEGGIREPMAVYWPGVIKPGTVCNVPVISTDFHPTILEIAGVHMRDGILLDGKSIVPLLKQSGQFKREAVYWHYPHYSNQGGRPSGAVRKGDMKLIEFYEDGKSELYNLRVDIGEEHNLVDEMPEQAADLRTLLHGWLRDVGAQMPEVNPNYDPSKMP